MAAGKLAAVALQVRWAHPVVGAVVAAFHHASEALHAVDMGLLVDVLTYTVPHRVTVAQARVAAVLIREHLRAIGHASRREAVQIGLARARHRGGADPPRRLVPCSGYRCMADRATARVAPVLGVSVLLQPAEERFIQFDRAIKQVGVVGKALADYGARGAMPTSA